MATGTKLSERDICTKFITPALIAAGWDAQTQIREEVSFTKGRIIVRGRLVTRGKAKRADYVLYYKHLPLALIEAKDHVHAVGDGMQQALGYAETLDIPYVFSSNGKGFVFHDRSGASAQPEQSLALGDFPSPTELWNRYRAWKGLAPDDDWIVKEVREHWHASKQRFKPAELQRWLAWMRQNDVIPLGCPPRTMQQTAMEL